MNDFSLQRLNDTIRDVPDFPKPGILFKDITPVLADPEVFSIALDAMEEKVTGQKVDKIIGIDARGFIFGAALADRMKAGFVPSRHKGKLPSNRHERPSSLAHVHWVYSHGVKSCASPRYARGRWVACGTTSVSGAQMTWRASWRRRARGRRR